jgi:hypothetical protein
MRAAEWFSGKRAAGRPMSGGPRDTEAALHALRDAMRTIVHDGPDGDGLGRLVAAYCERARGERLTPEHMLIRLKRALDEMPFPTGHNPMAREEARAHIVTLAINAYYDDRR